MKFAEHHPLLLQAAFADGPRAADAYRAWRSRVPLDDIDFSAFRILGRVVNTALRHGIDDPEMPRIRGVIKHTWLTNMVRTRALVEALDAIEGAGVETMVLKGAALFARYPALASMHAVADFYVLVRQNDAPTAIAAMMANGFRATQLRLDLFGAADFARLQGYSLEQDTRAGSIDLHWWPLPRWPHRQFAEQLFLRAERRTFAGRTVRVPALADHLFLTITRPETWETDEIFARAVEVVHILRSCGGQVDWERVVELCLTFHRSAMAAAMLALVQSQNLVEIPDWVVTKLRRSWSPVACAESRIRRKTDAMRSPLDHFALRAITLVQSHPKVTRSCVRTGVSLLRRRSVWRSL